MPLNAQLNNFLSEINREAEQTRRQLERETAECIEKELAAGKKEISAEINASAARRIAFVQGDVRREVSHKKAALRGELLHRRDELCSGLFDEARERLKQFTRTDAYADYITATVREAAKRLDLCTCTAYLSPDDMRFEERLHAIADITVKTDGDIKLGGIKIASGDGSLVLNNTLDARLEAERESFRNRCGLTII